MQEEKLNGDRHFMLKIAKLMPTENEGNQLREHEDRVTSYRQIPGDGQLLDMLEDDNVLAEPLLTLSLSSSSSSAISGKNIDCWSSGTLVQKQSKYF